MLRGTEPAHDGSGTKTMRVTAARVEETPGGPSLWVFGVRVRSELGCAHNTELRRIAEEINAAAEVWAARRSACDEA